MSRYMRLLMLAFLVVPPSMWAQATPAGPGYGFMNAVASCRTVKCVVENRAVAHEKLERIVLYSKWLLLDSSSRTASRGLLENLPVSEPELSELMTLPDWHEGTTKSTAEMKRLASVCENWPRLVSISVQRFPQYLPAYIRYGRLAVNDIHSDYTGYEQRVCRIGQKRFVAAFLTLTKDEQKCIRTCVFNPDTCTPIFLSEAE